ncbi:MAG TPA: hypothetical protein VI547_13395, partial [Anaerolineales bacterium]|nr:hypothetical protein [Anaerolineales bacterium]
MSLEAEVAYLHLIDGIRQNEVPAGFAVHSAPRKAARGRDRDVLMIGLYLGPGAPADLADVLTSTYFGTPGSVTAAARAAFDAASARLHNHNRYPPSSGPTLGGVCLAVLRGVDLYAALSGAGQILVIHPNAVERFPDSSAEPTQPFGAERDANVQYFHTVVAAADFALFTAAAPAGWDAAALSHLNGAGLESAIARLTRSAGANASAMITRFTAEAAAPQKTRPSILAAPLPSLTAHNEPAPTLNSSDAPHLPSQPIVELSPRLPLAPPSPEPVSEPASQPEAD